MRTILVIILLIGVPFNRPINPDMAPPLQPPGSSIGPEGQTQVEMASETVTITVTSIAVTDNEDLYFSSTVSIADVKASFTMRNTGSIDEQMMARFPLMNLDGWGDGYGNFPKVKGFKVWVNGEQTEYEEIEEPNESGYEETPIAWASFSVNFPVAQDVLVEVEYSLMPTGYYPQADFYYLLQTGSGWKGMIGSGDVFLVLPYEANEYNVLLDENTESLGLLPEFEGNALHWHFENLEPSANDNIGVTVLVPGVWEAVLAGESAVTAEPDNGQAWVDLASAYEQAARGNKGFVRYDDGGKDIFNKAVTAYEKSLKFYPEDRDIHYRLADLLYSYLLGTGDVDEELAQKFHENINYVLEKEPENAEANALLIDYDVMLNNMEEASRFQTQIAASAPTQTLSVTNSPMVTSTLAATKAANNTFKCGFVPAIGIVLGIYLTTRKNSNNSRR